MQFPVITDSERLKRLELPKGKIQMVLDTDTYNEVDDQFALAQALLSPDRLDVEAVYAAPFTSDRAAGPAEGMEKSYDEILRVMDRMFLKKKPPVFRGSREYIQVEDKPVESDAARDLVARASEKRDQPLYVVAIGAITNVSSALLMAPKIIKNIVVVWLGGHSHGIQEIDDEFNLKQDYFASRLVFDCGVPFVQIPCFHAASHLSTTVYELEASIKGTSPLGDYLYKTVYDFHDDHFAWGKIIWDVSAIGYLLNPDWVPTQVVHAPGLSKDLKYIPDPKRHLMKEAVFVYRDFIFKDLFNKIRACRPR
jgi:inosine-uridine nucleoside N-ribohydrolase